MQSYTRKELFRHWRDLASAKKFKGSAIAQLRTGQKAVDKVVKKAGWRKVNSLHHVTYLTALARENRRKGRTIKDALDALVAYQKVFVTALYARSCVSAAKSRFAEMLPRGPETRSTAKLREIRAHKAQAEIYRALRGQAGHSEHVVMLVSHSGIAGAWVTPVSRLQIDVEIGADLHISRYHLPGQDGIRRGPDDGELIRVGKRELGNGRVLLSCSRPVDLEGGNVVLWHKVCYTRKRRGLNWSVEHGAMVEIDGLVTVGKTAVSALRAAKRREKMLDTLRARGGYYGRAGHIWVGITDGKLRDADVMQLAVEARDVQVSVKHAVQAGCCRQGIHDFRDAHALGSVPSVSVGRLVSLMMRTAYSHYVADACKEAIAEWLLQRDEQTQLAA